MGEGATTPKGVEVIAVIGAGVLGRAITQAVALGGYRTILEDLLPNALRHAQMEIRSSLESAAARGEINRAEVDTALRRIAYAGSIEDAARAADVVIEAIADDLESKIEIFTLLDKICRPHTILVTNTFTLSVGEIASVTFRREKCVGMRMRPPIQGMRDLEIIRADETDDHTVGAAAEIARRIGKKAIIVPDNAGVGRPATSDMSSRQG